MGVLLRKEACEDERRFTPRKKRRRQFPKEIFLRIEFDRRADEEVDGGFHTSPRIVALLSTTQLYAWRLGMSIL